MLSDARLRRLFVTMRAGAQPPESVDWWHGRHNAARSRPMALRVVMRNWRRIGRLMGSALGFDASVTDSNDESIWQANSHDSIGVDLILIKVLHFQDLQEEIEHRRGLPLEDLH
jgi:hypothetical protein